MKADIGNGRTQITGAFYDIERDDILERYDLDSVFNIGGIRSRGVELAVSSRPNDNAVSGNATGSTAELRKLLRFQ